MSYYRYRPAPSGLHAKLRRELSERSPHRVTRAACGQPGFIRVSRTTDNEPLWFGHRDLMPAFYRGAHDPDNLLTRPASD